MNSLRPSSSDFKTRNREYRSPEARKAYEAAQSKAEAERYEPKFFEPDEPAPERPKQDDAIRCPKCACIQVFAAKKGFSVPKAAAGALLLPGGILWGMHGRNKVRITCMKCGHAWGAGD